MPWEQIMEKLETVTEQQAMEALPHNGDTLAQVLLFSLRIGDVGDLNKWLPMARLRPHVVLQLLFTLVDSRFPFCKGSKTAQQLKQQFRANVALRYPTSDDEIHLPEHEREGKIPPEVLRILRESTQSVPEAENTGILEKHATPPAAAETLSAVLEHVRPSALFSDRNDNDVVPANCKEVLALGSLSRVQWRGGLKQPDEISKLQVTTGNKFEINQWNAGYVSLAFPFCYPRAVGGADWPNRERLRRHAKAAVVHPWVFAKMLARRVEGGLRNDWVLVPAMRNLTTKWSALSESSAACKHTVDREKAGNVHAAELAEAAAKLYERLAKGYYLHGSRRLPIKYDVSKLRYADKLTPMERNLIRDLEFLSSKLPGTQQIRLMIGHSLFGARVEYGDPLFLTISPSAKHSGMCIRMSRYRESDPAIFAESHARATMRPWHTSQLPKIWATGNGDSIGIEIPEYDVRRMMTSRDPWAVMQAFIHAVKYILARLLGLRMCPLCPRCNATEFCCQNKFGDNMQPLGGTMGLAVALGGAIEYQRNDNPHFHGNLHLATIYQHKTLYEIADMLRQKLVDVEAIIAFQSWVCREEHFDLRQHNKELNSLEQSWQNNNKSTEHDGLCYLPAYLRATNEPSMWSTTNPLTKAAAEEDGRKFKEQYEADAQFVFSRCHHHWHPIDPRTNKRAPISHCRSHHKNADECKAGFPMDKRINHKEKVICPGNCSQHGLRVSGRRNALGSILPRRTDPWFSGTCPAFAVWFRSNTHTAPNYRVPLLSTTHDPCCKADCLTSHTTEQMIACAQRAQRNTTGYYTGYIQKRQPVGAFELSQATRNLQCLARSITERSNTCQFHHCANRMLGDLEFRGHVRPATEEFNLAGNRHPQDVMNAEFIRTFRTQSFCGGNLLKRLTEEKSALEGTYETHSRVPRIYKGKKLSSAMSVAFEELYGFRGCHPHLYYLSPWEFTKWWSAEPLKSPDEYIKAGEIPKTEWTAAGVQHCAKDKGDKTKEAPKAGEHYKVRETKCDKYVTFPDAPSTAQLRDHYVLVRNKRPLIPAPTSTPMPKSQKTVEERCRILSVYLRPWVLDRSYASEHVPHLVDLHKVISTVLANKPKTRATSKRAQIADSREVEGSYTTSWDDYRTGHVVSEHAARTIRNFLSTQLAESGEVDEDDGDNEGQERTWTTLSTDYVTEDIINDVLKRDKLFNETKPTKGSKKKNAYDLELQKALDSARKLWGTEQRDDNSTCKDGTIEFMEKASAEKKRQRAPKRSPTKAERKSRSRRFHRGQPLDEREGREMDFRLTGKYTTETFHRAVCSNRSHQKAGDR